MILGVGGVRFSREILSEAISKTRNENIQFGMVILYQRCSIMPAYVLYHVSMDFYSCQIIIYFASTFIFISRIGCSISSNRRDTVRLK